ncbi:DUF2666 family protein [Palaeococcus ferrophilus]|uniref:DUF2666 family protein n=1 Tax=Palaeococcus ferrophilus TaxID=83868 RepID=UPI00064F74F3|nr:DUF2666 family protein [Palaeococcus ferrophilus]
MKIEDHVMFTAKHEKWEVGEKLIVMEDENVAHFLAKVANTVNGKIGEYLIDVVNVAAIVSLAEDISGEGDVREAFKTLKSPGTSRKLGQLVMETDKKLKKLLVDVAKAYLVRETLARLSLPVDYPEEPITELKVVLPFHGEHVNFTAKHVKDGEKWIVVKRLMIDEETTFTEVARLLASINETATLKIAPYAGIDLKGIEEYFSGVSKKTKGDALIAAVEKLLHFPAENYAPEEFAGHARVYALRTLLEKLGLNLDIPAKSLEKYLEKKG